jgi:hypothetical protein
MSTKSVATSCYTVDAPDDLFPEIPRFSSQLIELFDRCATDQAFCTAMCKELSFTDLHSMQFFYKYGIPSTNHQIHATKTDVHTGHIDRVLKKVDPINFYRTEKAVSSATLFQSKRQEKVHLTSRALITSASVAEDFCFQLNKQFTKSDQAVAYHNCSHGKKRTPIVFDTGCSVSITPHLSDFIGPLMKPKCSTIKGVGNAHHQIKGYGLVEWTKFDLHGYEFTIRTYAYHVPSADIRLFSPQSYMQEQPETDDVTRAVMDRTGITLYLKSENNKGFEFPYHPGNNIPYMLLTDKKPPRQAHLAGITDDTYALFDDDNLDELTNLFSVVDETNQNISGSQKELQLWHWRL